MLVEADAVIAQPVHLLPRREMLGIGAHGDVGLEELPAERIGQFRADFHVLEVFAVGQQVEDKDLHAILLGRWPGVVVSAFRN
jgi:hypothetical protein